MQVAAFRAVFHVRVSLCVSLCSLLRRTCSLTSTKLHLLRFSRSTSGQRKAADLYNGLRIFPVSKQYFSRFRDFFRFDLVFFPLPVFFSFPGYFFRFRKDLSRFGKIFFLTSERIFRASKRNFYSAEKYFYVSGIFFLPKNIFPAARGYLFASARSVTKQLGEAKHNKGNKASKQEEKKNNKERVTQSKHPEPANTNKNTQTD